MACTPNANLPVGDVSHLLVMQKNKHVPAEFSAGVAARLPA
jgi:hypothetical protein